MKYRKKILVIDDEKDVLTYLSTFFADNDFAVVCAENGREGLKRAISDSPDVITLDISMPEESGVKLLRELQSGESTRKIPVIVITGVSSDLKRFLDNRNQIHSPEGYFEKPVDRDLLLTKVKEILKAAKK